MPLLTLRRLAKLSTCLNEAKAGRDKFFIDGRLPGSYWFNAVMLRGYMALYEDDKNSGRISFFKEDADIIREHERDADNLLGAKSL